MIIIYVYLIILGSRTEKKKKKKEEEELLVETRFPAHFSKLQSTRSTLAKKLEVAHVIPFFVVVPAPDENGMSRTGLSKETVKRKIRAHAYT